MPVLNQRRAQQKITLIKLVNDRRLQVFGRSLDFFILLKYLFQLLDFFLSLKQFLASSISGSPQDVISNFLSISQTLGECTTQPSSLWSVYATLIFVSGRCTFLQFLWEKLTLMKLGVFLFYILVEACLFSSIFSLSLLTLSLFLIVSKRQDYLSQIVNQFSAGGSSAILQFWISLCGLAGGFEGQFFSSELSFIALLLDMQDNYDPYFILQSEKYNQSSFSFFFLKQILFERNSLFLRSGLYFFLVLSFSLDAFLSYLSEVLRQISFKPCRLTILSVTGTKSMVPLLLLNLITKYYFIIFHPFLDGNNIS